MKILKSNFPISLKLTSLALLVFALFVLPTSCNKQSLEDQAELEAAAGAEEDAPPERYEYYLDSKQVEEGTFDPEDEKFFIAITGEEDPKVKGGGLIKIWAFSSESTYIDWGNTHGMPVECRLEFENHMQDYAEESGAVEHYERTGEILPEYEEYAKEYLAKMDCSIEKGGERGLAAIHKDYFGGSTWLIGTFTHFMPPGWNNRVSRYFSFGIYSSMSVYNRSFYRSRMATIWNWGWTNWRFWYGLSWLNDRMSSAIHFL